jgi:hypothetical protein
MPEKGVPYKATADSAPRTLYWGTAAAQGPKGREDKSPGFVCLARCIGKDREEFETITISERVRGRRTWNSNSGSLLIYSAIRLVAAYCVILY